MSEVTEAQTVAPEEKKVLTPEEQKELDLKRLDELNAEYSALKVACEDAAKRREVNGADLAKKGDVVREIDAIKRKYDLP